MSVFGIHCWLRLGGGDVHDKEGAGPCQKQNESNQISTSSWRCVWHVFDSSGIDNRLKYNIFRFASAQHKRPNVVRYQHLHIWELSLFTIPVHSFSFYFWRARNNNSFVWYSVLHVDMHTSRTYCIMIVLFKCNLRFTSLRY